MPAGRPRLFKTVKELQAKIDEYFDFCDNRIQQIYSKSADGVIETINPAPYGVEGLAAFLDTTRQRLCEYEKLKEFRDTIKRAKQKIASDVERRLMETAATGPIFNLKNNFGWKDASEVEQTHKGEVIIKASKLDAEL